jgi:hypothetical protein
MFSNFGTELETWPSRETGGYLLACSLRHRAFGYIFMHFPEDGSSTFFRNVTNIFQIIPVTSQTILRWAQFPQICKGWANRSEMKTILRKPGEGWLQNRDMPRHWIEYLPFRMSCPARLCPCKDMKRDCTFSQCLCHLDTSIWGLIGVEGDWAVITYN